VVAERVPIVEGVGVGAWTRRGLVAAVAGLTLSGGVSALAATSDAAPAPAPRLVEAATCAAPTPVAAPDGSRTDGDTRVSFQVPALTRLRVEGGTVVAVATNTGCAPRPGDRFVAGDRYASPPEVEAALALRTGDWTTPGAWHPAG
jgi:hypothetical protein